MELATPKPCAFQKVCSQRSSSHCVFSWLCMAFLGLTKSIYNWCLTSTSSKGLKDGALPGCFLNIFRSFHRHHQQIYLHAHFLTSLHSQKVSCLFLQKQQLTRWQFFPTVMEWHMKIYVNSKNEGIQKVKSLFQVSFQLRRPEHTSRSFWLASITSNAFECDLMDIKMLSQSCWITLLCYHPISASPQANHSDSLRLMFTNL